MSQQKPVIDNQISITPDMLSQLEVFITQPDRRTSDIFAERNFPLDHHLNLHWIIRHDIFEGVVMHLSLIDTEEYRHIAGFDKSITTAHDIEGEYVLQNSSALYRLHVYQSSH
ncbi:hypothetical protein SAMN00768000_3176 [Sulfobacillus thermosulfidooxidans DSM 9293]|uniref:Uncharacterized protein n=2 Tax=Sulfobacillus thermosulfidooxidans TaxID=28034 RepID=A0A1W1WMU0_SULTA|nr:hypothetical protein [Sulfobacillus thermosulfidooxidans]PSR25213.1 MAG: hypothetical protein C7B47_12780 [Sulfobacillus thermosulfidooxidans]SMC07053.1 hypothetical protein SAMN00768000_3176 [Sulfobacillus thermosulfidooxidans DSM 9293]